MITAAEQRLDPAEEFKLAAYLVVIVLTTLAVVFGGMPILLMALASALSIRVYFHPDEVIAAAPLFLLAANVLLPSSARFDFDSPAPIELVYWAVGSLMISLAPVLKSGFGPFWKIPNSLKTFTLVAIAASVFGLAHGSAPSYVLRQLYGLLLLVAYFAFALNGASEEKFMVTLRKYSVPCAAAFVAYYVYVFPEFGFHREMTTLGTQCIMLAILFVFHRGLKWRIAAAMMLIPPLFLVVRRDLAAFAAGVTVIAALGAQSKLRAGLVWILVAGIVTVSLVPASVAYILDKATDTKLFDDLLPEGGRDSTSIQDRGMQLAGAAIVVARSPVFGNGMGSELEFESVVTGTMSGAYVDNGWAYLLAKMGFAGVVAFAWFVLNMLQWIPRNSIPLSACLLTVLLLIMFAEPVFFHFSTSPFVGAMAGLLYAGRSSAENRRRGSRLLPSK